MELSSDQMTGDGSITVSIALRNAGKRAGKEVVQLYMRDLIASSVRPVATLIGFEKVELAAGERKVVTFTVTEPQLRFYDLQGNHISEAGEFALFTGHADHLILETRFCLT